MPTSSCNLLPLPPRVCVAQENLEPVWSVSRRRQTVLLYHCSERVFACLWDMHFTGHNERNQEQLPVALGQRLVDATIKLHAQQVQVDKLQAECAHEEQMMEAARARGEAARGGQPARPQPTAADKGV